MSSIRYLLALVVLLSFSTFIQAAPGDLDASFGGGKGWVSTAIGTNSFAYSVIQQADGKLVTAGSATNGSDNDFAVVRYSPDGTLDTSFNGTGKVTTAVGVVVGDTSSRGRSVIQQADGKLVVAGYGINDNNDGSMPDNDFAVVRYSPDGTLDTSFNGTGKVTTEVGLDDYGQSVIQQLDGKLVVAGFTYKISSSNYDFALVRYNSDGTLDTGFNGTGKIIQPVSANTDFAYSVIQQADGKLVVAGYAFVTDNDFALVRYNSNGTLDTSFNGTGKVTTPGVSSDYGQSLIQQTDGKLVVAGYAYNGISKDFALVRYNLDGSLDTSFNGAGKVTTAVGVGDDLAYSVIQQSDSKLVVAGYAKNGGNNDFALVRYNDDGSLDTSFNGTGKVIRSVGVSDDYAYSVIQQTDGKLVVAGSATGMPTGREFVVARFESGQPDTDGDGLVDGLDTDNDDDGFNNFVDNCIVVANADQKDTDHDGLGDVCDATPNGDTDNDGIDNLVDNCIVVANADQLDADGDSQGDACDADDDSDGVPDVNDAFPLDASESVDTDGDGIGDNGDPTPHGDTDNDGIDNLADNCVFVANANQFDTDHDGVGNVCDTTPNGDDDGDGIDNLTDNCLSVANANQLDWDGNGVGDACDAPVPMPDDLSGEFGKDKAGTSVAFAGDFNGDGYGDYVVGISGFDVSTKMKDAGRAEVISGKDRSVLAFLSGTAAKDALGTAVAGGGDIDGDGFADAVVGAPNAGATHAGTVTVIYGRADGDDRTPVTINGTLKKSLFGAALALGDVNGDSRADIIIGAPKDNDTTHIPVVKLAGSVTAYGVADTDHPETITALGTPFYGAVAKAYAGTAVAAGDLDGNGVAIVIGAPNDTVDAVKSSGSVKAYLLNAATPIFSKSGTKGSQFGKAIAVGDIDQLGHDDVLIGAPLDDDLDNKRRDAGSISTFSGVDGAALMPKHYGTNAKVQLGYSVAVGDVNNDGFADIIAGAWKDNKPTSNPKKPLKAAGSVSVFSGSGYAQIGTTRYGDAAGDNFGAAISAGDINSDGKSDIIIGIPGFDHPVLVSGKTKLQKDAGKVTVVSGIAL